MSDMDTIYVVMRIRDHTAEYWSGIHWTQDVAYSMRYSKLPDISEGDDVAAVPFNPALNQRGVCLVMQDNPRPKECIRHGDTREIMDADQG